MYGIRRQLQHPSSSGLQFLRTEDRWLMSLGPLGHEQAQAQAQAQAATMSSNQGQSQQRQHPYPRPNQQHPKQSQSQQQYWSQYQQSKTPYPKHQGLSHPHHAITNSGQAQSQHVSQSSSSRTTPGVCALYDYLIFYAISFYYLFLLALYIISIHYYLEKSLDMPCLLGVGQNGD
jgi:hypothetical protein